MAKCARLVLVLGTMLWTTVAAAQSDEDIAHADRIAELERKVEVLTEELERTRSELAVPDELPELQQQFGYGPAASKIYGVSQGLSIGGYGEGFYRALIEDTEGQQNRADALRTVLYLGYKFTDSIVFNSEIEFEHATTSSTVSSSGGSVSVEFAALDFFMRDYANARVGLLLVPMGFINEVHEPPFFYGVNRPEVERRIIPSTWRENGFGLFGQLFGESVSYTTYLVNGFNAAGFDSSGLRGGRQNGNRALADHLAWVGRADIQVTPELLFGGAVYLGSSGQNQKDNVDGVAVSIPSTFTQLWELHADYRWRGLHLRWLFTMAHLQDAGRLTESLQTLGELAADEAVAREMLGVYGEIGYDILPLLLPDLEGERSLEPFFRYEFVDTQRDVPFALNDPSQTVKILTTGLHFKPIPNVVLKADYRYLDPDRGTLPQEFNVGFGFAF